MAALEGTEAIVESLQGKIDGANRYIANTVDPIKKASAIKILAGYEEDMATVIGMDPDYEPAGNTDASGEGEAETETVKTEPSTGNAPLDNANLLSNILNSPLYSEAIKNSYLADYLPGLTQATYNINAKRTAEVQNSVLRQQAQQRAIRNVAGDFAARGLRTPKMITEGIDPIQQTTERAKTAAQQEISGLENSKELNFGAGTEDEGSFISNPAAFGAIGANARRAAIGGLQSLPQNYGMTQVENASTAPSDFATTASSNASSDNYRPTGPVVWQDPKKIALQNKITAGEKYVEQQRKKGNAKTVAGGNKKIEEYRTELYG